MNKREERDHKFKLLFCTMFYPGQEIPGQLERYFESPDYEDGEATIHMESLSEEDEYRLRNEVQKIVDKIPELDERIDSIAEGWKTGRMSKTDLTVLRLALYEIVYDDEVPEKVSINEAVEIAKKYGGNESGAFVNGILARLVGTDEDKTSVRKESRSRSRKGQLTSKTGDDHARLHILFNKTVEEVKKKPTAEEPDQPASPDTAEADQNSRE